jgi:hypothetical protein
LGVVVEQGRQRGEAGAGDGGAVVEEVFGHGLEDLRLGLFGC